MSRIVSRRALLMASVAMASGYKTMRASSAATPVASGLPSLPELAVTITDSTFEAPSEIPAGRYLLSVTNRSASDAAASFILPPAVLSLDEVAAGLAAIPQTAASAHGTPSPSAEGSWFYDYGMTAAGGSDALAGATSQAIIDLQPGRWVIWTDDFSNTSRIVELNVTGEMPAPLPAIESSMTVTQNDTAGGFEFVLPGVLSAGPLVVEIANQSSQPHVAVFMKLPRQLDVAEVKQVLGLTEPASPIAGLPTPDDLELALAAPIITSGVTQWQLHDFEVGFYAVLCDIPDPLRGGAPHAAEGMVQIIEVR